MGEIQTYVLLCVLIIGLVMDFANCKMDTNNSISCESIICCTECVQNDRAKCVFYQNRDAIETKCQDESKPPPINIFNATGQFIVDSKSCDKTCPTTTTTIAPTVTTMNQSTMKNKSQPTSTNDDVTTTKSLETTTINPTTTSEVGNSTISTDLSPSANAQKGGFHGWSFFGGIILVLFISLIAFFGFKYYKSVRDGRPFAHRLFGGHSGFATRQDSDEPGFPF